MILTVFFTVLADLDNIIPPWEEDNSILSIDEDLCQNLNIGRNPKSTPIKSEVKTEKISSNDGNISPINSSPENNNEKIDLNKGFTIENSSKNANDLIENIKDFLHNESKGVISDEQKLGEDFLVSLAKALDLEDKVPNLSKSFSEGENLIKNENVKKRLSDSGNVKAKVKNSSGPTKNIDVKPKLKFGPFKIGAEKLQVKNLRLNKNGNENEKPGGKGPLKAVIPVKNMEKNKKSLGIKQSLQPLKNNTNLNCATPNSSVPLKRTSTPLVSIKIYSIFFTKIFYFEDMLLRLN